MNSPRLTALVPVLMVMALPLGAGEAGKTPAAIPPLSAEQEAFWKEFQNGALSKAQIDAEAKYVTARAAFQDGRFVEARELVDEAIRIFPSHAGAQQLLEQGQKSGAVRPEMVDRAKAILQSGSYNDKGVIEKTAEKIADKFNAEA